MIQKALNKGLWPVVIVLLAFFITASCKRVSDAEESEKPSSEAIPPSRKTKVKTIATIDYLERANSFAAFVLKDRLQSHEYEADSEEINHFQFFSKKGLRRIYAFSDRGYPKYSEPRSYEHFTLFCFQYQTDNRAKEVFKQLRKLSQIKPEEVQNLDSLSRWKIESFSMLAKPGGFLVQKGKCLFSLVNTCRNTPIGGSWLEYENLFLHYLNENEKSFQVLNADCGYMKYNLESRSPKGE